MKIDDNILGNFDRQRIEQVFINLMSNAVKNAPASNILIELRKNKNKIEFCITDHGPGIPKDKHELIFKRFERTITTHYSSGLGIGLYISKNIVEGHGGSIHVQSQEGQGAKFIVRFPA